MEAGGRYEDMELSVEYLGMRMRCIGRVKCLASHRGRFHFRPTSTWGLGRLSSFLRAGESVRTPDGIQTYYLRRS